MANPQKENGYTPISNELLEAFLLYRFPPNTEAPRLLWLFVVRKTYGFSKKSDTIALSKFTEGTGLPRNTVVHWLEYMVKALLLVKGLEPSKNGYTYTINKDYETWIPLVKALKLVKGRLFTSKSPLTKTSKSPLTHKNKKQIYTKAIIPGEQGSQENQVNLLMDIFYETINPTINYARKDSRDAAQWMIDKWGFERVEKMTRYACSIHGKRYAPTITTPFQLKEKLSALKAYKDQNSTKKFTDLSKPQ